MLINSIAMSRWGPGIALAIARLIPRNLAYRLGEVLAGRIARDQTSAMVQGIRANQAVVQGLAYEDPSLDGAVRAVLRNTAHSLVDVFKTITEGRDAIRLTCVLPDSLLAQLHVWMTDERGLMIIGPHMMGFDAFIFYLGVMGYPVFALSYPNPSGSYVAQNALRQKFGFNIKPVSVRSLKEAMKVLRQGGTVMTAVDRPGLGGEPFQFFGRSAILPVGYARLAVKTNSPIMVGIPHLGEDGVYTAECADFLEPPLMGSEAEKSHTLAQKVLDAFEVRIREEPERWLMFYPVWPEVIPSAQT